MCNWIQGLLLLLILANCCISAEHYHIVPNDSTSQCQDNSAGTCFTLAEFASNISHLDLSNHLTLSFLPGEHLLTKRLAVTGPQNITLTGQNTSNSSIIKCQGTSGFEFGDIQSLNIEYLEFTGCGNVSNGGAISINTVDMFLISGCHFVDNHATLHGGAILVKNTVTMNIEGSVFNNNSAAALGNKNYAGGAICVINGSIFTINSIYINNNSGYVGGAIYIDSGNITSTSDQYINNSAVTNGGAIYVDSGNITSASDHYINNSAYNGGAIYVHSGNITSASDHYINNSADNNGGAIYVDSGTLSSTNDKYINNSADDGGAIYINSGNIYSTNGYCINNSADSADSAGGAIYVFSGNICSTNDHYINNSASEGGAIYMASGSCNLCNDSFTINTAAEGAVIYKDGGILKIGQTNITDNFASNKGTLFLKNVTLMIAEGVNFMNNQGSLYVSSSQVQINGAAVFMNNLGRFGGAITAIQQSQIIFNTSFMVTISNNSATYGGGIYLAQSNLQVYHPFELTDNKASEYGGGIYASRSEIDFKSEQTQTLQITNNTALNGGALCAIASTIHFSNTFVHFNSNTAITNGGAMYLGQNSKIQLIKHKPDYLWDDNLHVRLDFTSNSAEKGGAIYVADNTIDGVLCQGADTEINQAECFIQTLGIYNFANSAHITYINTFLTNNTALISGSDIYGGLLDQCTINPYAELLSWFPDYIESYGFHYIKATTQIEQIIDYSQYARSHPDYLINNITKSDVKELISSDGILNFCSNHVLSPKHSHPAVSINKGELFTVSVVVVDQVGNPVNATVSSSLSSESGNGHFKGGQVEQKVRNQCTELEYNVYPQDISVELHIHLYAEGPCGYNMEVSKLTLNLTFLLCECPVGFQPSPSQTECVCECDRRLKQHQITRCFAKNGTIQVETNIWVGLSNDTNGTGFVIHDCPFDYCVQKPVNISLSSPDSADEQCAYNRTGSICGMCKDLSLVFGSSRCQECSSYYIFLLIPFALAGIALVAFILLFNMTVATGTIHGLIFYANILTANRSLFVPFATPNFLTVFISWLNLDLGIETCFYNGMDSYGKFLLQLAFPTYVFLLIGTTIVLCEVSRKFACHAPFTPRHRYWMGILLFALTTHNIVAAMSADSPAPILSAGCIALGLILLRVINSSIYKNSLQDSLETLFLTNIVILAVATYHVIVTNEDQLALANTSMAISFILFLIILGYHFYKYILKGTRVWARVTQLRQRLVQHPERHREFDPVPLEDEDNDQDEQMIELQPPYTDDYDTDPIDLPHHYDPPVIVPAVRYDQPREPALDILDPITTDDYRQLNQPPAPRPRQVPTTTVIDFV